MRSRIGSGTAARGVVMSGRVSGRMPDAVGTDAGRMRDGPFQ
ncbi:MAG: hypothetical protein WBO29_10260 [Albidovulum sp.]